MALGLRHRAREGGLAERLAKSPVIKEGAPPRTRAAGVERSGWQGRLRHLESLYQVEPGSSSFAGVF